MGADDFMEKPLVPRECLFRVQALMRRYNAPPSEQRYTIVNFEICGSTPPPPITRYVCYNGREIDLLHLLAIHAGQVLTHEQIRRHVWGDDFMGDESNAIRSVCGGSEKSWRTIPSKLSELWGIASRKPPSCKNKSGRLDNPPARGIINIERALPTSG